MGVKSKPLHLTSRKRKKGNEMSVLVAWVFDRLIPPICCIILMRGGNDCSADGAEESLCS